MNTINAINNQNETTTDLTIDPGSGDSYTQYSINTTSKFRIGVDDDDSDKFKISSGSALGTNDIFVATSAGEITKPLQPAFLAVLDANINNCTGNSVTYTVVWDTTVFDQNSDFNGTTTFTAPVTGRFRFDVGITYGGITSSNTNMFISFVTSNRSYTLCQGHPYNMSDASGNLGVGFSIVTDMDAADTAYVQVNVNGGTQVIDLITNGSTDTYCWFSGNLEV